MTALSTDAVTHLKRSNNPNRPRIFHQGDRVEFTLETTLGRTDPMRGTVWGQNAFGTVRVDVDNGYPMYVPACGCKLIQSN